MRLAYFFLLLFFLLPETSKSQSQLTGLTNYQIGATTLNSLNKTGFTEGEQLYVKGTLALECPHIRTYKSAHSILDGIPISNLVLCFYDEKLFMLSCDYNDTLQKAFQSQNGLGKRKEPGNIQLCSGQGSEPMVLWGEFWQNADILAFVMRIKGITNECTFKESTSLVITSRAMSALSSECNFQELLPFAEEFRKMLPISR